MRKKHQFQGKCKEGRVLSADELPDGYVPIGPLNETNKPLHSFINRECRMNRVNRYRVDGHGYGKLYVHRDDIARLEEQWNRRGDVTSAVIKQKKQPARNDAYVEIANYQFDSAFDCLNALAGCWERIEKQLERLVLAVEMTATQPKDDEQLRREIHAACENTNGFHN